MATILSIDTATENALVCLANNEVVIDVLYNNNQKDHASFVQVAIKSLCLKHNIELKNIDAIAVTAGPGSYTGLRVGLSSAKGICYALNKPLLLINTLQAIAQSAILKSAIFDTQPNALICPMIDARRMEVFTAVYTKNLQEVLAPCAMILNENSFEEMLKQQPVLYVGNGAKKINVFNEHFNILTDEIEISADTISYLANQLYVNQEFANLAYAEPFYIKPFIDQAKL